MLPASSLLPHCLPLCSHQGIYLFPSSVPFSIPHCPLLLLIDSACSMVPPPSNIDFHCLMLSGGWVCECNLHLPRVGPWRICWEASSKLWRLLHWIHPQLHKTDPLLCGLEYLHANGIVHRSVITLPTSQQSSHFSSPWKDRKLHSIVQLHVLLSTW